MDCLMPTMDGYQATAAIRQRERSSGRHLVIIAMTALVTPGERERCMAAGMDDYLSKPASDEVLTTILQRWFPGAHVGDERAANLARRDGEVSSELGGSSTDRSELTARLVNLFLDDTASSLAAMRGKLQRGEIHGLEEMAHALKGSCQQLGQAAMAELCGHLEANGRSGDRAAAQVVLGQLAEAFEQARSGLVALKTGALGTE
jgi:CheY-like chemotaxis protein